MVQLENQSGPKGHNKKWTISDTRRLLDELTSRLKEKIGPRQLVGVSHVTLALPAVAVGSPGDHMTSWPGTYLYHPLHDCKQVSFYRRQTARRI